MGIYMNGNEATIMRCKRLQDVVISLMDYCAKDEWAGFDPYDALNSRIFTRTPFHGSRICRLAFTQTMKRLPFNLRPLLLVPKKQNPKAIGLFLRGTIKLSRLGLFDRKNLSRTLVEKLVELRSPGSHYWCWGYSFPWQTRTILVPRWAPNLVCTAFVANALLDTYDEIQDSRCLNMATSAAEYIVDVLYRTDGGSFAGFSYPVPTSLGRVHNANLLGAALLCRIYKQTSDKKFLDPALKAARYSAAKQRDDGSWAYGESPTQSWADNFHTGYNLCALQAICDYAGTLEFQPYIRQGFDFYRKHFFREDGAPKYFHDRTYPIDAHSVAQSIITLLTLKDIGSGSVDQALSVFKWAMNHLWDEQGYFYYQVFPFFKNKISYMRWTQAWMFLALSTLLEHCNQENASIVTACCAETALASSH